MAIPATATKAVADKVSAAWANDNVKSPIDWLMNPPRCQVSNSTGQATADATLTVLNFDTEAYDSTGTMHDPVTNNSRIVLPETGLYLVHMYVRWDATGVTFTRARLQCRLNGATAVINHATSGASAASDNWFSVARSFERTFTAGDYIELLAVQTSGASRTTSAGNNLTGMTVRQVATS